MRIAAMYDIHGNLPALEAVLQDVRREGAEQIVVGGDVLPGPMQREALEYLLALDIPVRFIRGNGERETLAEKAGAGKTTLPAQVREILRWSAAQLDDESVRLLSSWPATLRMEIPGLGATLFCHATPRNDWEIFTRLTPNESLVPIFAGENAAVVVCGHTHMQFDRTIGNVRVVNAGSVGMPFGAAGAYWLLLGPTVALRRTDYDLEGAAQRLRQSTYPQAHDFAERYVLHRPSEQEMLSAYSRTELK